MSILPKESILSIAETVGLTLSDEVGLYLVHDTEYRLREIVHEAVKFMRHSHRKRLLADDVAAALSVRNVEPLFGFINGSSSAFKSTSQGSKAVYYLDDREYDIEELINRPLPPVPVDVTYTAHWLAVDGVQPKIIQNPSTGKATATVKRGDKMDSRVDAPLVMEVLTRELQMYYEKILEMVHSDDESIRSLGIDSVTRDPGIQGLMPYFVQFVADTVTRNLKNLRLLFVMMRFLRGILSNPNLDSEPYLHQMIPAVLTCVVAKRLCESSDEDHWSLRVYASSISAHICITYGASYQTLEPRVTKTLLRALLDPSKPIATIFGAVTALECLGKEVVRVLVLPNISLLSRRLQSGLDSSKDSTEHRDAQKCFDAILSLLIKHYGQDHNPQNGMDVDALDMPSNDKLHVLGPLFANAIKKHFSS